MRNSDDLANRITPRQRCFRRVLYVVARENEVRAELEDDFHRFRVTIRYGDGCVSAIRGEALRYPWTSCPGAARPLQTLVGMTLDRAPDAVYRHADGRLQCTHMFELAGVAIAQATRAEGKRLYEMCVTDPVNGIRFAQLIQDGTEQLKWAVRDEIVGSNDRFDGKTFKEVGRWAAENGSDAIAEPALLLRRAARLSVARQIDVDSYSTAADMQRNAICHSYQPDIAPNALRVTGSHRDFDSDGSRPLGDLMRRTRE